MSAKEVVVGAHMVNRPRFWELIERLSDCSVEFVDPIRPAGEYRNAVSNERQLQAAVKDVEPAYPAGAYVGVGPEQNLTLISAVAPSIAFIVDIQRKNLLLHLLYKALCERALNRGAFLCELFGRANVAACNDGSSIAQMLAEVGRTAPSPIAVARAETAILATLIDGHGCRLSEGDIEQLRALHKEFVEQGPAIRRDPNGAPWVPSFSDLMMSRGEDGIPKGFLASDARFRMLQDHHRQNKIIPIQGDIGSAAPMTAIARALREFGETVEVIYLSNVGQYLSGEAYEQLKSNIEGLPRNERTRVIRTVFSHVGFVETRPDYHELIVTETIEAFVRSEQATLRQVSAAPAVRIRPLGHRFVHRPARETS